MKNLVKRVLAGSGLPALWRWRHRNDPLILMYHGVIADEDWWDWGTADMVSASAFREHLDFFRRRYRVVPLKVVADALSGNPASLPPRTLVITFDDGYRNSLVHALPALEAFDMTATLFVTTGFIDETTDLWWLALKRCLVTAQRTGDTVRLGDLGTWTIASPQDAATCYRSALAQLKTVTAEERQALLDRLHEDVPEAPEPFGGAYWPATWDEIRALHQAGMEIGAHTVTHPILSRETPEDANREIADSVARVREQTGAEEVPFSYPNGMPEDFTQADVEAVREAGCYAAVAGFPGSNRSRDTLYALRRTSVSGHHTPASLELDTCGMGPGLRQVFRPRG